LYEENFTEKHHKKFLEVCQKLSKDISHLRVLLEKNVQQLKPTVTRDRERRCADSGE
jgi:hypothetical protein